MIKGLSQTPKLCLKKVLIENSTQPKFDQSGYIDLYTDKGDPQEQTSGTASKINLTFDFDIKIKYPTTSWASQEEKSIGFINFQKNIQSTLSKLNVVLGRFTDKNTYNNFMASSHLQKQDMLMNNVLAGVHWRPVEWDGNISSYTSYDNAIPSVAYISVPVSKKIKYTVDALGNETNPTFLAYVCFLHSGGAQFTQLPFPSIVPNSLTGEIIFNDRLIPSQTGFFTIGDTFGYEGEERSLFETSVATDAQEKDLHFGFPWQDNVVVATDPVTQINTDYGAPGDIWLGPMHMHKVSDVSDSNFGKYRAMGGAEHNLNKPHPYLDYNIKPNTKIVDFRSTLQIENMFSYNSTMYEKLLAATSDVLFTGSPKKDTIDELVKNKAIVSDAHYSIRPSVRTTAPQTQDNIHFIFAIDKMMMLKNTSQLPGLLDKLMWANKDFGKGFVDKINIFHFEILRINQTTGASKSLLVGNNDKEFSDPTSGCRLKNKTSSLEVKAIQDIEFYEFTDGTLDNSGYDKYEYTYKIVIQFKDPLIEYLTDRLNQARKVIKDLDELVFKLGLQIYDNSRKKYVDIYDRYQLQVNNQFVQNAINPNTESQLPLTFPLIDEIPASVISAFPNLSAFVGNDDLSGAENLTILLTSLSNYDDLQPTEKMYVAGSQSVVNYIKNSLKLSSTSPTLVQKVRELVHLMEARLTRSLTLYTNENITKKDTGFTFTDYLESTNVDNAGNYVIEFDYTFNNSIDLSTTKNKFNWISAAKNITSDGLKTITIQDYINMVTVNSKWLLSDTGKSDIGAEANFSYSFLPIVGSSLDLFNTDKTGFDLKYFQTIRKRLFDRTTDSGISVSIPEILSFFGIRFKSDNNIDYVFDDLAQEEGSLGTDWKDNWGEDYVEDVFEFIYSGGGAAGSDPDTAWQGGSHQNYPVLLAKSLINILNTDNQEKSKDISFLRNTYNQVFEITGNSFNTFTNKQVPFEINLFSTADTSEAFTEDFPDTYVAKMILHALFNTDGGIKYFNYSFYALILSLFGKVYYLRDFEQGESSVKLTPSSYFNRSMVKSMNWESINKSTLDQLPLGKDLLCKVELYENINFLDTKVVNLFEKYYDYNKYFFISSGRGDALPDANLEREELIGIDFDRVIREHRNLETDQGPTEKDLDRGREATRTGGRGASGRTPNIQDIANAERAAVQVDDQRGTAGDPGEKFITTVAKSLVNTPLVPPPRKPRV